MSDTDWTCPRCGLIGDHLRVPKTDLQCRQCCTVDVADELLSACKELLAAAPAFRSKPEGAPGSTARRRQEAHIQAEDNAREIVAKAEGRS